MLHFFLVGLFLCFTLVKLHYFHVALFPRYFLSYFKFPVLHSLHVALFSYCANSMLQMFLCCTLFMLHLFSFCTLFMLHLFCVALFWWCTLFTLHFFLVLFILVLFYVELCSCCTFLLLHSFQVALFPCCTFFILYFFYVAPFCLLYFFHVATFFVLRHVVLISCCTFFVLHSFRDALFPCCTFFLLHIFWIVLFSGCTFFILYSFHVAIFFVLHSFHIAPFLWCTVAISSCFIFFLLFYVALFSWFIIFFILQPSHPGIFSWCTHVEPFLCRTVFMLYLLCTLFILHLFFHVGLFSCDVFFLLHTSLVALFSCCSFFTLHFFKFGPSLLTSFLFYCFHGAVFFAAFPHNAHVSHYTLSCRTHFMLHHFLQSKIIAAILKLHLIMQLFQWVFKAADLSRTLSAFFYKTLQQYFSVVDKNDMLWSWGKNVMSCAQ